MHITKQKKPTWKGYVLYDSNYRTISKQYSEDYEMISCCQG